MLKIYLIKTQTPLFSFIIFFVTLLVICLTTKGYALEGHSISSAAEINYPPFSSVDDNGQATGFSVDLLRAALATMDRDVTFRTGPWAKVRDWLETGEIDALPLVGRTPEREPLFDFTFPYMTLHGAIVVRKGTTDIEDLEDLEGRTVAVMKGDNAEEFLRRTDRGIDIHTTPTFEVALEELSQGRHDAVFIQRLVALRLLQKTKIGNLRVIDKPVQEFRQDFCFAVKEGDRDTLALLNEGLSLVMADGTYRHLHAKWFASLELPAHRRIVVGGDHNYPPFEYLDENGNPTGFNTELVRAIAQEVGLDIQVRLGPWSEIRQALREGKIDAIQGMLYSPERDLKFDFTPPYTVNHYVSVVRKGEGPPPTTAKALKDKRIIVQQGDIMHDFALENDLDEQMHVVKAQEHALKELVEGKYDCALVARLTALYWIQKYGWDNLVISKRSLASPEYSFAVPNNNRALAAKLSEGLKLLEEKGEYRRIRQKWIGVYEDPSFNLAKFFRYLAIIVIPLLAILLAVFLWSWSLRRQVASKTRELQRSTEFQQAIIACSPVALFSIDFNRRVLSWNASAERILGWKADEVIGKPLPIIPDDKKQESENLVQRVAAGENFIGQEVIRKKKDGTLFTGSLSVAPILDFEGKPFGIMGAMEDITKRKEAEQALRRSESLLNTSQHITKIGGWEWDVIRQEMFWTDETYRIHDLDPHDTPADGESHMTRSIESYSQEDRPRIEKAFQRCVDYGEAYDLECAFTTTKGRQLWIRTLGEAVLEDGQIVKVHGSIQDITEQKRARQLLDDQNQFIQTILDNLPIGLSVNSIHNGKITYMNRKCEDIYGWPKNIIEDIKTFFQKVFPDEAYRREIKTKIMKNIQSGDPDRMEWDDLEITDRDGKKKYISVKNIPLYEQNLMISTVQEVTERKKLETQLIQAQKMESIGRLAGGVAHDYNNMLGIIQGYTDLALLELGPDDQIRSSLEEVLAAAKRSADITRQLLAFSRQQTINPKVIDLNETVEGMLKMLRRLIGEDIDLTWNPGKTIWPVYMDPSQIDQIMVNLCVNARDAINDVGKITIETDVKTFDQACCADHFGCTPGDYVMLSVSDNGCGIDKETQINIFEPFFTTKEIGKGTGLGLATVYGIVKQNEGFISLSSQPGQGSSFMVYLPRHEPVHEEIHQVDTYETSQIGNETVLLVEDDTKILRMARSMLYHLGYNTYTASTPSEAVGLAYDNADDIQLLITDVVMPDMNGRELSEKIQAISPSIKVLYMSGYTSNVIAHRGVLDEGIHFIQKPFTMNDLSRKIRKALDE